MRLKSLLAVTLILLPSCSFPHVKPDIKDVSFDVTYKFSVPGKTSKIWFVCLVPKTIENRQSVLSIDYSVAPLKIKDIGENRYAEFIFLHPKEDFEVKISVKAQLIRYDLLAALTMDRGSNQQDLQRYLTSEKFLNKDDPAVSQAAGKITGRNRIKTIINIYDYVLKNMEYAGCSPEDLGAAEALKSGKGDCSEYADLFVTLCRAKSIPARVAEGYYIKGVQNYGHAWAEVYLEEYGWVPFDPTFGDLKSATFGKLQPVYIYLSNVRNDKIILNRHFYTYWYWGGSPIKVTSSFSIR